MSGMIAFALCALASNAAALPQGDLRSRLRPISGPIRDGGVYHLATGTWTRQASAAFAVGPDVIYDNTCSSPYFYLPDPNELVVDEGTVPSPTHPRVPTVVPGACGTGSTALGNDEAAGCRSSYVVNGFRIGYGTSNPGTTTTVDLEIRFQDSYNPACAPMNPTQTFALAGLPGCAGSSCGPAAWLVTIDLAGSGQSFTLIADGTGTYAAPSTADLFGWSFRQTNGPRVGPFITGNRTWTGGPLFGPQTPCRGTDGTIWAWPQAAANPNGEGTGMSTQDFIRIESGSVPDGCYYFGGQPLASFWLELYSNASCPWPSGGIGFCDPGQSGVMGCSCGNFPGGPGRGCDNSAGTGGALVFGSGFPSLANDSLQVVARYMLPSVTCVLLQGDVTNPSGTFLGDGIRCIAGSIKRIGVKTACGGMAAYPEAGDLSISARSSMLGDPISPLTTRYYQTWYRDPASNYGCTTPTSNITNGLKVTWGP